MALQAPDEATAAAPALRTLSDALDIVLGDGGSSDGAKKKRVAGIPDDQLSNMQRIALLTTSSTSVAVLRSATSKVLHTENLMTSIVGWLFHERHTVASRVALDQISLVNKECQRISRQTCFWRPLVRELLPVMMIK